MCKNLLKTDLRWLLLWAGLVASALLSRPPLPIDETRYLSVAWEMWHSNQFLVPHINGVPYSHKPPLLFWLIHLGWWLFGVNEWSARLTPPLFGLASLFLIRRIATVLWPALPAVGQTAPLILLSMGVWSIFSTLTMFDTLIVFFTLAAYLLILTRAENGGRGTWLLLGLVLGLGLLAKGPVILVYVAPPILLAPLWTFTGNWWRWYGGFVLALCIGVLVALAWAIPAAVAGGEEYGQAILFRQTAGRMVQSFAHRRPVYWYLLLLPLVLFPWSLWLPFWRGWKIQGDNSLRFCLSILVPSFVALSIVSGKQIHYLLPLLPIAAIVLGRIAAASPGPKRYDRWPYLLFFTILAVALVVLPTLPVLGREATIVHYIPWSAAFVPLLTGCILVWLVGSKPDHGPQIIAASVLLHLIFLHLVLSQSVATLFNPSDMITAVSQVEREGKPIAVYPKDLADQFHFAARLTRPVTALDTVPELQVWSRRNPTGYCLVFADREFLAQFGQDQGARPYRDKWLMFRRRLYSSE
ncbi:MAG: glycosyltransferase family 39 protein [Desulfoprunum sp.]|jgi:4-amino-4-deoxy-L-arabinose transferase-like glycosyltransferase|uniref:ArnT family glycosyltransferase n=1 Tax=Desulfoprunum sp. TaxID=2020866 RepID=UPI0006922120